MLLKERDRSLAYPRKSENFTIFPFTYLSYYYIDFLSPKRAMCPFTGSATSLPLRDRFYNVFPKDLTSDRDTSVGGPVALEPHSQCDLCTMP